MAELIHCITNPISMTQCANTVLGLGARPIMAEHPLEVGEITKEAAALLINTGNISDIRMEAMKIAYGTALEKRIPVVIDAVGVACSKLRRDFVLGLLERTSQGFLLIKGNYSEIKALAQESYKGKGVDADESLEVDDIKSIAKKLSEDYNAVILASGAKDIIADNEETFFVNNGNPMMGQITGTGCMLGAVCATFLSRKAKTESVIEACGFFGVAGETSYKNVLEKEGKVGSGSFLTELLNAISLMDIEETIAMIRLEKN